MPSCSSNHAQIHLLTPKDQNDKFLIIDAVQTLVQLSSIHDLQPQILQIFRALNQVLMNPNKELHELALDVSNFALPN